LFDRQLAFRANWEAFNAISKFVAPFKTRKAALAFILNAGLHRQPTGVAKIPLPTFRDRRFVA